MTQTLDPSALALYAITADGGAAHVAACIRALKQGDGEVLVEALTGDFGGDTGDAEALQTVLAAGHS